MTTTINLKEISEALLYSNVPYFLFKKVTNSSVCYDFSKQNSTDKIVSLLNDLLKNKNIEIEDIQKFYLYIGSLYIKGDFNFKTIDLLSVRNIYWAKEVISIIINEPTAQTNIDVNVNHQAVPVDNTHKLIISHSSI